MIIYPLSSLCPLLSNHYKTEQYRTQTPAVTDDFILENVWCIYELLRTLCLRCSHKIRCLLFIVGRWQASRQAHKMLSSNRPVTNALLCIILKCNAFMCKWSASPSSLNLFSSAKNIIQNHFIQYVPWCLYSISLWKMLHYTVCH